jgi:hypothetical protein
MGGLRSEQGTCFLPRTYHQQRLGIGLNPGVGSSVVAAPLLRNFVLGDSGFDSVHIRDSLAGMEESKSWRQAIGHSRTMSSMWYVLRISSQHASCVTLWGAVVHCDVSGSMLHNSIACRKACWAECHAAFPHVP